MIDTNVPGNPLSATPTPKVGDRVRMTGDMPNDPAPVRRGEEGTVTDVLGGGASAQIVVNWDSGRGLMLLADDPFEVLR